MPSLPREQFDPDVDERLLARCRAGDGRAWGAVVRRYERLVYAIARGYRLSPEDTADVFQEVFAALVRGLPRLREARTLCRWLSSTTERIALATALHRRREQARDAGPVEARLDLASAEGPVGAEIEELENQMRVRLALAELGSACRSLLSALYYRESPAGYREISADLGIPIGSIGPTRARCLEKLQRVLTRSESAAGRINAGPPPTFDPEGGQHGNARSGTADSPLAPTREERPHAS